MKIEQARRKAEYLYEYNLPTDLIVTEYYQLGLIRSAIYTHWSRHLCRTF